MIATAVLASGVSGYYFLSWIGFTPDGPRAKSFSAFWQSFIGNVKSGSLFAICQALGMTGIVNILIGKTAAALTLLAGAVISNKLDWCTC